MSYIVNLKGLNNNKKVEWQENVDLSGFFSIYIPFSKVKGFYLLYFSKQILEWGILYDTFHWSDNFLFFIINPWKEKCET